MKLIILLNFFVLFSSITFSQTAINNSVQNYANLIMNNNSLSNAAFSFYVKDMNTNEVVADFNGTMSIPSASTMKLVTTATATQILGRGYKFETTIAYSGYLDTITGILNGDIYLIGGGDPTLGSRFFTKHDEERLFFNEWINEIKAAGIKRVQGKVIADGSLYNYDGVPAGWVWGDLGNYYGAGPAGLTVFDNMCRLQFETGANAGDSTHIRCIEPHIPGLFVQNAVKSANSKRDNAYVYGAPFSFDWFVQGSIPKAKANFEVKASIPDPEYLFAIELDYALNNAGIQTQFKPTTARELGKKSAFVRPDVKTIFINKSPSLGTIMNLVNQKSVNLFAEHVLCQISVKQYGYGSTASGAAYCEKYWQNKIGGGLFMSDGSGLSRSNAVSAKFLTDLLAYMHKSSNGEKFKASLAVAGKSGTMYSIGKGTSAAGIVYGKSGTMNRIKSYAGYVDSKSGKKLAYAMIINNHSCSSSQIKKYFETLMIKMANY
ncbi:D-alanyl-D-alanine carboxypeptidase/D-alanyl-D-alanine endopeptidase [Crocinitomix catalasitica]|uniref:D-alanyl-D-alanine carboxypeptidase/D-alanyl-D-alanine endopeptidase n=1 Tax=Crocinitomix catalasitica TaxID=184607 RepID=UPI0004821768|nr:D-alanyl-D-alanine carboxypeptidase/D-alanyl-D-alanine-endopeptidase [Crocinitomix catalasitica]